MKELPLEIYSNINKMNSDEGTHYTPSELRADCKAYVKALKAGRLMFIERWIHLGSVFIYIRSYEGTSKKGSYRSYDRMITILEFVGTQSDTSLSPSVIHASEDLNADILSKIYELGFIKEEKYKKLKEKQVYNFTY